MKKKTSIPELKNLIRYLENCEPPKIYVAFEYEGAPNEFYFSAFTVRHGITERFSLKVWADSQNSIFGKCGCPVGEQGIGCGHLEKALTAYGGC